MSSGITGATDEELESFLNSDNGTADNTHHSNYQSSAVPHHRRTSSRARNSVTSSTTPNHSRMMSNNYSASSSAGSSSAALHQSLFLLTLLLILVICLVQTFYVVHPGEVGIVVTLGHVTASSPGLHVRAPLVSSINRMTTKTQKLEQGNSIPTKEGLSVFLDTAILYRIDPTKAAELFKTVGVNYCAVLLEPEAASAVRGLTSEKEAKALYTSGRNEIQQSVKEELMTSLGERGIIIEAVLLKDITLPQELSKSIELKAKAEQDAARMEWVLQKERQEADRKAIEARGIAGFQQIVSEGISSNLLKWKGIEATEKLAESPNAKIVMVGNSDHGLPVLFSSGSPLDHDPSDTPSS